MTYNRALHKLSIEMLERMLALRKRQAKIIPLEQKRAKLAAALKKIDAQLERLKGGVPARKVQTKKRTLSAAGRRRIIAATKARWARVRAEKKEKAGEGAKKTM